MRGRPKKRIDNSDIVAYLSQFDSYYPPPSWLMDVIAGCARLGHGNPSYPETIYSFLAFSPVLTSEGVRERINRRRICMGKKPYKESYTSEIFTRVVSARKAILHYTFIKTGRELKELVKHLM